MGEMDFLLTDAARQRLLHWTLGQGAILVPDEHYNEPAYEEIRSPAELERFAANTLFHVLRADWQVERLLMKPYVNKTMGPGFYIAQRYGGPALMYLLYPQREEDGRPMLGRGSISHYPFYHSAVEPQRRLEPGDSLKAFYRDATRFMKDDGLLLKATKRSAWVAREGVDLLRSGLIHAPKPYDTVTIDQSA
jgi:hypothetical protein